MKTLKIRIRVVYRDVELRYLKNVAVTQRLLSSELSASGNSPVYHLECFQERLRRLYGGEDDLIIRLSRVQTNYEITRISVIDDFNLVLKIPVTVTGVPRYAKNLYGRITVAPMKENRPLESFECVFEREFLYEEGVRENHIIGVVCVIDLWRVDSELLAPPA